MFEAAIVVMLSTGAVPMRLSGFESEDKCKTGLAAFASTLPQIQMKLWRDPDTAEVMVMGITGKCYRTSEQAV